MSEQEQQEDISKVIKNYFKLENAIIPFDGFSVSDFIQIYQIACENGTSEFQYVLENYLYNIFEHQKRVSSAKV